MKLREIYPGEIFFLAGTTFKVVSIEKGEVCVKPVPKGKKILYGLDALQRILIQKGMILITEAQDDDFD